MTRKAHAVLQEMEALSKQRFVTSYGVALVHAGLGQIDEAFHWRRYVRAQHLGDAIYLFVRACGLAPDAGVWRQRFDDALIDAVDAALGARA